MSLGNTSIHQQGEVPEITKLPNGRIRVVRRFVKFTREDVDNIQLGTLLGNFGDLDTAGEQIPNQGYTNCRLIEVEVERITKRSAETDSKNNVLVQTYETLTDSFVETTDPTISIAENGLKQITKVYRAISGTVSSGVIGETQLTSGEFLASSQIEDNTAFAELTEVYLEAGTLSETLDSVGSQKAKVIETIGIDPVTPDDYSLASKQESDFEGFQTNRFTFLKDDVQLSQSEDKVGSQNAITEQWFKPEAGRDTKTSYSLARKEESDVEGIPTERYTFLEDDVELSRSEDKVGSQLAITTEVFKPSADPTEAGYSLARTEVSDVDGIPTKRYTFLKDNVELSRSEDKVGSQLAIVTEIFKPESDPEETGYSVARIEVSDVDGIPTKRFTFLKDNAELSRSEDLLGSQLAIVTEVFNPDDEPTEGGYSLARTETSDVDGIPTKRFTFLKDGAELSRSEDKVGSQLAITTEVFKPEADPEESGYSVARIEVSDVDGIPTKRFTLLKDDAELSRIEDLVGSQLAIVTEVFKPEADPEESGYVLAKTEASDVDGIPTKRFTLLKEDVELSRSEDKVGSQLAIVTEVFKPIEDPEEDDYSIARTEVSDVVGIPTKRFTFLKDDVELSRSEDNVGSQLAIVTEVFKPTEEPEIPEYVIGNVQVSDVEGIPTKRFTFLKENVELSRSEDLVGSQLAIVTEVFKPTEDPEEDGYVLARTEISDVVGIPTKRYTFLKDDVKLSEKEDKVGSQLAKVQEWFNPADEPEIDEYVIADTQISDVGGIPTKRYTFLKENVELSRSEDLVGSQLAIITEVFKPTEDPEESEYSLARTEVSDVVGIPTKRYTFLKDNVKLSETEDKVGSQLAKVEEWFNPTDEPEIAEYVIANIQISDVGGIPTKRFTFLKENVELSRSEDLVGSQLAIVTEVFNPTEDPEESEYSLARTEVSDVDGIPTKRYTFLKDNVKLSESEDEVGSQLAKVQEWFKPTDDPEIAEYVIANTQISDVDGIPTKRYTLLKENVELSRSEDLVGSQLAITTEVFKPTEDPEEDNYSVARTEISDVVGIPTKRFTFLKDDAELSRSEDFVGSQLSIVTEVFNPTDDPEETGYSVARTEVSDVDGIPTKRFTFLKDDVELFHSEDLEGGLNETVEEWFKPDPANNRDEKTDYVLIEKTESDLNGIPTERYTFWKEKGLIDESFVNEAEGVIRTTQVFFSEIDDAKVIGPIVSKDTRNLDGIPTITVQTLQGETGVSIIGEGDRLANDYQQLVSFTYPGLVSIKTNPVGPLFTSYAWRLSPPVECVVEATTFVFFQSSNTIVPDDYTYSNATGHWNPTEWAKGESYGLGYGYKPFSESKGFRGYRADPEAVQVYENAPDNYLINGNRLYEDTTGGLNIYGGPEDPSGNKYVLDVKITPAFVDVDGTTNYKKVIVVATIPQQEETPVPEPDPPTIPEPDPVPDP